MTSEIESMAKRLVEVVGYDAPAENQATFDILHRHVYRSSRGNREGHIANEADRLRYGVFVQCCVSAVPKAFRACLVHRDEVADLERRANEVIKATAANLRSVAGSQVIGNTVRFDATYHAFLFAFGSCLEYYHLGMRNYFGIDRERAQFRQLGADLRALGQPLATALATIHANRIGDFAGFALGWDGLRNQVAHRDFLKPAHVVAIEGEFKLVGGSEDMALNGSSGLADLLTKRMGLLDRFLRESFEAIAQVDWP